MDHDILFVHPEANSVLIWDVYIGCWMGLVRGKALNTDVVIILCDMSSRASVGCNQAIGRSSLQSEMLGGSVDGIMTPPLPYQ